MGSRISSFDGPLQRLLHPKTASRENLAFSRAISEENPNTLISRQNSGELNEFSSRLGGESENVQTDIMLDQLSRTLSQKLDMASKRRRGRHAAQDAADALEHVRCPLSPPRAQSSEEQALETNHLKSKRLRHW